VFYGLRMSAKRERRPEDVQLLAMILFYLWKKGKVEFSSLIRSLMSRLMSLHLGLDSELHNAVVTVELLDILYDVVLIISYPFPFLRKSYLVYLWLKIVTLWLKW
jgi:hypothetical protein